MVQGICTHAQRLESGFQAILMSVNGRYYRRFQSCESNFQIGPGVALPDEMLLNSAAKFPRTELPIFFEVLKFLKSPLGFSPFHLCRSV